MAKVLRVKTPKTTDGKTLMYDDNRNVVYDVNIMGMGAKKHLLSLNAKLPTQLKHDIEEIDESEAYGNTASQGDRASLDAEKQALQAEREEFERIKKAFEKAQKKAEKAGSKGSNEEESAEGSGENK